MCVKWIAFLFAFLGFSSLSNAQCNGHFVNPIKDVCWRCLFPLSIGSHEIVGTKAPNEKLIDTSNADHAIGVCGARVGLNIGYWEPMALADVTDTPYCLVNLGGHKLPLGLKSMRGGREVVASEQYEAFFHVHWYKYPLIAWLNLITSVGCQQGGDFDIAYLTELDPTWHDSSASFLLNPEAALFGNPVAAISCAADGLSSTVLSKPLDKLFWCAGTQGTHFPLNGYVNSPVSPVQTALLLTERMNFKLHRQWLLPDSNPKSPCLEHHYPVTPKSRYRYEMVNQVSDGTHAYASGHSTIPWEAGKIKMHKSDQYGFLIWRKRNCVFL